MQTTEEQARDAIRRAGTRAANASVAFDEAVHALTLAWRNLTAASDTLRLNRALCRITAEGGPLELRMIHYRAAYLLAHSMIGAGYPWPGGSPLHDERIDGGVAKLVGHFPDEFYLGKREPVARKQRPQPVVGATVA